VAGTGLNAFGTGGFCPIFGGVGFDPAAGAGGLGFEAALTVGFPEEILPLAECFDPRVLPFAPTAVITGFGVAADIGLLEAAGILGILRFADGGGGGGGGLVSGSISSR
jgi:hypothetical protein